MPENRKDHLFIFIRDYMMMGGIETYLYHYAKYLKEQGATVAWVKHPHAQIDDSFRPVFFDGETLLWNRNINCADVKAWSEGRQARITVITFDMFSLARAEAFRARWTHCPVHTFFFVPNFTGPMLYVEEAYRGKKRERVQARMGTIVRRLHQNNQLRYFNEKHREKMTSNYGYTEENPLGVAVPPRRHDEVFDEERCRRLAREERFHLLTVSRFDFPHKGYLLGLIEAYGILKERHPLLDLTIVGYGPDQARVEAAVAALSEPARRDVHLCGKVPQEELGRYYEAAHLNISVAGCCALGARQGTISLPARHFTEQCEVYGFFPESKSYLISDEPGQPVIPYIEQVMAMTEEEYVRRCRAAFDTFHDGSDQKKTPMDQIQNTSAQPVLTAGDVRYLLWREWVLKVKTKCRRAGERVFRRQ